MVRIDLNRSFTYSELQSNFMLYGLFVNSLSKTKEESFKKIKGGLENFVEFLKRIFINFDNNKINKERTFIFQLRSSDWGSQDFYIIDGEDYMNYYVDEEQRKKAVMKLSLIFYPMTGDDEHYKEEYEVTKLRGSFKLIENMEFLIPRNDEEPYIYHNL